ncbi:histidine phosphatase family protein [Rothia halotolerans]|uniref:histidine phosphatase family protein n=1 Tax=Rothia halotolerans TaxID=405770 RepID=UPI0013EC35E7|nr:histidine phosphatase family protein [Rothia halotolerans]
MGEQSTEPSIMSGRLVVVRHGQTDWNRAGKMQGSTDIPLNDTGREQARVAGRRLRELTAPGESWDALVASPLSRAQETARIIGEYIGISEVETVPGIIERGYGDAEGEVLSYEDTRHPQDLYAGVEPEAEVYRRGVEALREVVRSHPGQEVVAVSHGTLIRRALIATTPGDWSARIPNAEAIEVDLEGLFSWDPASLELTD